VAAIAPCCDAVNVIGWVKLLKFSSPRRDRIRSRLPESDSHRKYPWIGPALLNGVSTLGITSGASTPEVLVTELIEHLSAHSR